MRFPYKKYILKGLSTTCIALITFLPGLIAHADSITISVTVTTIPNSGGGGGNNGGGGGGRGGGGGGGSSCFTQVTFQGVAYPGSNVNLVRDGRFIAKVPAGPDARFQISITNVTEGTYTYGIWSEDHRGVRSVTQTFTVAIAECVTTIISGIFLPPTIDVDKSQVRRGDPLTVLGQTVPDATVSIVFHSETELNKTATADKNGIWNYVLDTLELDFGSHSTAARSKKSVNMSPLSQFINFTVGTENVANTSTSTCFKYDLNCDGKINLIDFSILAFWYKRPLTAESAPRVDFNSDGKVDLVEFSILAYYWTG
jgi:hypothetical protein